MVVMCEVTDILPLSETYSVLQLFSTATVRFLFLEVIWSNVSVTLLSDVIFSLSLSSSVLCVFVICNVEVGLLCLCDSSVSLVYLVKVQVLFCNDVQV
jgi:hypothetical protein